MMGGSHAISGAAVWLATATLVPGSLMIRELDPLGITVGALVCAGAALLPDADHPSATIANSIPVFGKIGANAISGMVGGHRHGTHSLLAIPTIVLLAWLMQFAVVTVDWWNTPVQIGAGIAVTALTTFAIKSLGMTRSWAVSWLVGVGLAAIISFVAVPEYMWVPEAVVVVNLEQVAARIVAHLSGEGHLR